MKKALNGFTGRDLYSDGISGPGEGGLWVNAPTELRGRKHLTTQIERSHTSRARWTLLSLWRIQ